jgi:hypothetical protein
MYFFELFSYTQKSYQVHLHRFSKSILIFLKLLFVNKFIYLNTLKVI